MKHIAEFYKYLHKKNNGVFYRSTCIGKEKLNGGYKLGFGKYYTWEKGMAEAFGKLLCGEGNFKLEKTTLSETLKLLALEAEHFVI